MKSIIELLELVKANRELMLTGLCSIIYQLYYDNIITTDECNLLMDYIKTNRPVKGSKHYESACADKTWYWSPWKWEPRERWLNAQIRKLSRKNYKDMTLIDSIRSLFKLDRIDMEIEHILNMIFDYFSSNSDVDYQINNVDIKVSRNKYQITLNTTRPGLLMANGYTKIDALKIILEEQFNKQITIVIKQLNK